MKEDPPTPPRLRGKRSFSAARRTTPRASSAPRSSASAGPTSSRPATSATFTSSAGVPRCWASSKTSWDPSPSAPPRPARPSTTSASSSPAHTGRVLFDGSDGASAGIHLAVWDPLSAGGSGHLELPVPILPRRPHSWNAALLCCDQHGLLDHADGHFRVVLEATDSAGAFACVYSSLGPAAWSEPAYTAQHPDPGDGYVDQVRSALVRNAFYFLFQRRTSILKHDLATGDMSAIRLPPAPRSGRMLQTVLTTATTEDGARGLGFARVEGDKLCLWTLVNGA